MDFSFRTLPGTRQQLQALRDIRVLGGAGGPFAERKALSISSSETSPR